MNTFDSLVNCAFSGYDATTFALKIKMPSVVLLREYSLLQHLRKTLDSFHTRTPFDHKEVLKVSCCCCCLLATVLRCSPQSAWTTNSSRECTHGLVLQLLIADTIAKCFNDAVCTNASSFAVTLEVKHEESANEIKQIPIIKVCVSHWLTDNNPVL